MPLKQATLQTLWSAVAAVASPSPDAPPPATTGAHEGGVTAVAAEPTPPITCHAEAASTSTADQQDAADAQASSSADNTTVLCPAKSLPSVINSPSLPPQASIQPLTDHNLPAFRRLVRTLLPVRYPEKTFAAILANAGENQIARVLVWTHSSSPSASSTPISSGPTSHSTPPLARRENGLVVGAICARIQPVPAPPSLPAPPAGAKGAEESEVYVQMLGTLAPYRGQGLAGALLREVLRTAALEHGVRRAMAHVWEANAEALEWYRRRGFTVEPQMVESYYHQLRPRGAWVVRRRIGICDCVSDESEAK